MLRIIYSVVTCLLSLAVFSQPGRDGRSAFNSPRHEKPLLPQTLAQNLISGCSTEAEKVKAIFRWITGNIDYMVRAPVNRKAIPPDDTDTIYRSLDERVALSVLEKKVAICEGYARLFKTLCAYAGIRAEIIHGYAKGGRTPRRFGSNHTWNAVLIDNEWKLLDLTWSSGYVTWRGDVFVRSLDEHYYLTSPEHFIVDHYPDDLQWALMAEPPLMNEFRTSPFLQRSFVKYSLKRFHPSKGIIEATIGEKLELEVESNNISRDEQIGADPFLDTSIYNTNRSVLLTPVSEKGNIVSYQYEVKSKQVEWLYVLYNNDVVLRYRLYVR